MWDVRGIIIGATAVRSAACEAVPASPQATILLCQKYNMLLPLACSWVDVSSVFDSRMIVISSFNEDFDEVKTALNAMVTC